ncbi:hypothetical protein MGG_05689 [Pyricularia oryzae 70-15]|uniref:Calcineurin-like phosphoesterase domain-containing protein n=1 Tax=Pyricularia oryzae (strain 70-15 / ATCC MYA-4617 / FGSC 8958) TaxID=242507 RepID=G4MP27_PYRO7|nr:uncharacterized protein MGG_05689 [Pyricularia oryzae 70-15]EHA57976.1 hypothetical protein MGG_05689 [Pyricularia oryzae 70-15]
MQPFLERKIQPQTRSPYHRSLFSMWMTALSVFALFGVSTQLMISGPPWPPSHHDSHSPSGNDDSNRLVITRDTDSFRIAIFADLHLGEKHKGDEKDRNTSRLMEYVIRQESPNLAVLNGDLIAGEDVNKETAASHMYQAVRPMVDSNLPWASTYGNHDSQFNLSRDQMYTAEREGYPALSLTRRMGPEGAGVSNYYVLVEKTGTGPVMILWFFDSRGGAEYQQRNEQNPEANIDDWVLAATADWFRETSKDLRARFGQLPSLAFVHIPPHVFRSVAEGGLDAALLPGLNADERPLHIQGEGHNDDAFVKALMDERGLHSVHSSHDHGSSWCAPWPDKERGNLRRNEGEEDGHDDDRAPRKPPILCFSKRTGYGGYGNWNRGVRILEMRLPQLATAGNDTETKLDPGLQVDTWVRMETGKIVTHVSLNETYGKDHYPTANGE